MRLRRAYPSTGNSPGSDRPESLDPGEQKYLRFWGVDYPYLGSGALSCPSCLPVPARSVCHRVVDDYNRMTFRGSGEI